VGGCGQDFEFESLSDLPMMVRASHGKLGIAPKGLLGGHDGKTGAIRMNDQPIADKTPVTLRKGDVMRLLTPGSGGMREPRQESVDKDTRSEELYARHEPAQQEAS
jgi:N-methylhydantoinase B/oxoprolinase/acetone carboxylase alpha subunit